MSSIIQTIGTALLSLSATLSLSRPVAAQDFAIGFAQCGYGGCIDLACTGGVMSLHPNWTFYSNKTGQPGCGDFYSVDRGNGTVWNATDKPDIFNVSCGLIGVDNPNTTELILHGVGDGEWQFYRASTGEKGGDCFEETTPKSTCPEATGSCDITGILQCWYDSLVSPFCDNPPSPLGC